MCTNGNCRRWSTLKDVLVEVLKALGWGHGIWWIFFSGFKIPAIYFPLEWIFQWISLNGLFKVLVALFSTFFLLESVKFFQAFLSFLISTSDLCKRNCFSKHFEDKRINFYPRFGPKATDSRWFSIKQKTFAFTACIRSVSPVRLISEREIFSIWSSINETFCMCLRTASS